MRNHRRYALISTALALVVTFAAPTVEAGGSFNMHLGSSGFGVSVGFGDWGVYTQSWSDPYWSINFNASLAGYGEWVWVNGLGRVWRPWVATSWRPYTYGRWVSTGYGLTWVAYEPWGYFPHHYGNWAYASFGWVWVPGYSYSCANVVWVGSGGHVGWYARPPHGWSHARHGFHHGYRHGFDDGFRNGYSDGWHEARYATYVDWKHFGSENVSRHAVTHRIASNNRVEVLEGAPSRDEIRQRGGAAITETRLSRRSVRVDGREVTIARPEGVAPSIERNAAETVGSSLSEEALERRQPQVRQRTASASSRTTFSRREADSRDARSSEIQRSSRGYTSEQRQQTGLSARSSDDRPSTVRSAQSTTRSRASAPSFDTRQDPDDSRHIRPRTSGDSRDSSNDRSESARSISTSSRSTATRRPAAQQAQQTSESQRSSSRARQSATETRRSESTQLRASESRRPRSRSERSATERKKKDSEEKSSEEASRRRRR